MQPEFANTGYGPNLSILSIGLDSHVALVEADTGFWSIIEKTAIPCELSQGKVVSQFQNRRQELADEMQHLRFGLKPTAAYVNPTERCNFDCDYCYIPKEMRRDGHTMTHEEMDRTLERLATELGPNIQGAKPQIIFHGSEPMLAREQIFAAIERFGDRFDFGVQTNASLLDDEAIRFLTEHGVGIGISLDAPDETDANTTRKDWAGNGAYSQVVRVLRKLVDYPAFNVICTVTSRNVTRLKAMVHFLHDEQVRVAMLNPVRCTQPGGLALKPDDAELAKNLEEALELSHALFRQTGRKLVIANFANVLAGVLAPTGRRLMCDISPCGGGRCFVAVAADGGIFPCSEFVGLSEFRCGSVHTMKSLDEVRTHPSMRRITERSIEAIEPCARCAIRHFCGAPCPAEVAAVNGSEKTPALYCKFYEWQARYALRLVAQGRENDFLWDDWLEETEEVFSV